MLLAARRAWRQSTRSLRAFLRHANHQLHPTIAAPGALASLRYYGAWKASLDGASALDDERPWITFAATRFLERAVRPGSRVFEWGSGGSTLFFRNLGAYRQTAAPARAI
ncbi:MAG: hypothetical protein HZB38_11440 [Planctomycetes bacterium]|nr:hypothetical protein [Planctomycetota bacterium]